MIRLHFVYFQMYIGNYSITHLQFQLSFNTILNTNRSKSDNLAVRMALALVIGTTMKVPSHRQVIALFANHATAVNVVKLY